MPQRWVLGDQLTVFSGSPRADARGVCEAANLELYCCHGRRWRQNQIAGDRN